MEKELLTINQVAELLQVSRATIYEYIADPNHPLPVFYLSDRTPRFKRADIEKWLTEKQQNNGINKNSKSEGGEQ